MYPAGCAIRDKGDYKLTNEERTILIDAIMELLVTSSLQDLKMVYTYLIT